MKRINIDIETRSSVDLKKYGAYRYAEAPDFQILLFGYSIDGGPVEVIDTSKFATVEDWPAEIVDWVLDPQIDKHAFNANFERVCLSRTFLGDGFLDPSQWHCTMIQSAEAGYGGSLDDVAKTLKLAESKGAEGTRLINFFSKPLKDGTYRSPEDHPEKWSEFTEYNRQDVVVEKAIAKQLKPISKGEQRLYVLDQEINDRGVLLDMELVDNAVELIDDVLSDGADRIRELTGVENPNSNQQIMSWLSEQGIEMDSLNKEAVADQLKNKDLPPDVRRYFKLRRATALASVKKYISAQQSVSSDGRLRGLFRFYGAHTGRWCLTGDHEVLTQNGWERLDEWGGGTIACWEPNGTISFSEATQVSFPYEGDVVVMHDSRIRQISTPEHRMPTETSRGTFTGATAEEMFSLGRNHIRIKGSLAGQPTAEDWALRVLVMAQADGQYSDGFWRFRFKKERKIERCKWLLDQAGIKYRESVQGGYFSVRKADCPEWLDAFGKGGKKFGTWLWGRNPDVFFEELKLWDGWVAGPNSIEWSTSGDPHNADMIQAFAHLSGRYARIKVNDRSDKGWSTSYRVTIHNKPTRSHSRVRGELKREPFSGRVYCAETTTGWFLVRRNGCVWVTGNSGKSLQPQNLPKGGEHDADELRALVRAKDRQGILDKKISTAGALKDIIRTVMIPKPGHKFIVFDFSAIEAVVLAWLAGEDRVLGVFRTHGKLYEANAAAMFSLDFDSIQNPSKERDKGKIATLACGYQGAVGAITAMGGDKMGLSEDDMITLVKDYRRAHPNTVQFWWDVESAFKGVVGGRWQRVGPIEFRGEGDGVTIVLPSKRTLHYPEVELTWDDRRLVPSFIGKHPTTGRLTRLDTYGGRLAENITQATARDLLALAMMRLAKAGFDIVLHVHDEAVLEVPDEVTVEEIQTIMEIIPKWAGDLPLRAAGFETNYYRKD